MNRNRILEIVHEYGDQIQLNFGTEFGYFASQLDFEDILNFCEEFNTINLVKLNGYRLSVISSENPYMLNFTNYYTNLNSTAKLLDHTVYIEAKNEDWKKIDKPAFSLLQSKWRNFLAKNIYGYREHFNSTCTLETETISYSI